MNLCVESAAPAVGGLMGKSGIMSVGPLKDRMSNDGVNTPSTNASRPLSPNGNYLDLPSAVSTPNTKISDPIFTESEDSCAGQAFDSKDFVVSLTVDVAVVGSEHAGLTAAIAIHRRTGLVVHAFGQDEFPKSEAMPDNAVNSSAKFEQKDHPQSNSESEMISLPDRVLDALYSIDAGLYDDVMNNVSHTSPPHPCGSSPGLSGDSQSDSRSGDKSLEINSSELMKALQRCARGHVGIKMHHNNQLLHVHPVREQEKAEGLALHFEDGTKVLARMVVAADGINSTIRQIVETNGLTGETESRVHYFGLSAIPDGVRLASGVWMAASEGERHQVSFRVSPEKRTVMWTLTEPRQELGSECVDVNPQVSKQRICEILGIMASTKNTKAVDLKDLLRVIEGTPCAKIHKRIYSRPFLPANKWTYHAHQLVLLGDAAHPLSRCLSNGFDLAIEDAVQLACCLSDSSNDRRCALRRFEEIRQKCLEPLFKYNAALNARMSQPDMGASNQVCECLGEDFYSTTFLPVRDNSDTNWPAALLENTEIETEYM